MTLILLILHFFFIFHFIHPYLFRDFINKRPQVSKDERKNRTSQSVEKRTEQNITEAKHPKP